MLIVGFPFFHSGIFPGDSVSFRSSGLPCFPGLCSRNGLADSPLAIIICHSGDDEVWTEDTKEMLDDMHVRKIDMADEIFVINVGGYIGDSTRSEIEYATRLEKTIRYLE